MTQGKQPHILNASSNLLGICFVIITGLKLSKASEATFADEISTMAAIALLGSCVLSYISMRSEKHSAGLERIADYLFIGALVFLFGAVLLFSISAI